jgi:hypothetical protein
MTLVTVRIAGSKRAVEVMEHALRVAGRMAGDVKPVGETRYERRRRGGTETVLVFEVYGGRQRENQGYSGRY